MTPDQRGAVNRDRILRARPDTNPAAATHDQEANDA